MLVLEAWCQCLLDQNFSIGEPSINVNYCHLVRKEGENNASTVNIDVTVSFNFRWG
jgi:hypothetical protein